MHHIMHINGLSKTSVVQYCKTGVCVRLTGDFACVKAKKADKSGNLMFHSTAQNFNPDCAKAGR